MWHLALYFFFIFLALLGHQISFDWYDQVFLTNRRCHHCSHLIISKLAIFCPSLILKKKKTKPTLHKTSLLYPSKIIGCLSFLMGFILELICPIYILHSYKVSHWPLDIHACTHKLLLSDYKFMHFLHWSTLWTFLSTVSDHLLSFWLEDEFANLIMERWKSPGSKLAIHVALWPQEAANSQTFA